MTMLTTPCAICGAKAHTVGARKTSTTTHAVAWQFGRTTRGHRWIVTLTTTRINAPHSAPADQAGAPAQPHSSGTPSRTSQRRKRCSLAKNKGKLPAAAQ